MIPKGFVRPLKLFQGIIRVGSPSGLRWVGNKIYDKVTGRELKLVPLNKEHTMRNPTICKVCVCQTCGSEFNNATVNRIEELKTCLAKLNTAIKEYIYDHGLEHSWGPSEPLMNVKDDWVPCPEDSTCSCMLVLDVDDAIKAAEGVLAKKTT